MHTEFGYLGEKIVVIPNGFDLKAFRPDPAARRSVRHELGIGKEALIIGLVGRFHPLKDHGNFIDAAARLHSEYPEIHFLLCGDDVTPENTELGQWIAAHGIGERCHLLGPRDDIPKNHCRALTLRALLLTRKGFPM